VHHGDRSVGALTLQRGQERQRPTDGQPSPNDHQMAACELDPMFGEQREDAVGGAREGRLLPHDQFAQIDRVQPIGVLGRAHDQHRCFKVEPRWNRVLQDERIDPIVGVHLGDDSLEFVLSRAHRHASVHRGHAHVGTILVLTGHVPGAGAVVAHKDGAQPRRTTLLRQNAGARKLLHPDRQLGLDPVGQRLPVQCLRSHGTTLTGRPYTSPVRPVSAGSVVPR